MAEVDDYLAGLDEPARTVLGGVYARARAIVPDVEQGRSYGMPALQYRGKPLVSAIETKRHLSLFPFSGKVVAAVVDDLDGYDLSKGTIRFTAERPLPDDIVTRVVELRRAEIDG
jgi:uncharacterized protein YdhG (YjbR/CyaY superfamily)